MSESEHERKTYIQPRMVTKHLGRVGLAAFLSLYSFVDVSPVSAAPGKIEQLYQAANCSASPENPVNNCAANNFESVSNCGLTDEQITASCGYQEYETNK